jgi:hypothetical protein
MPSSSDASDAALTGSCGCGAVRFTVSGRPDAAAYCHCTRCQKRTGTAAQASARVAPATVTITEGVEHLGDWTPPGGLAKSFCRECGSHLFGRDPDTGEIHVVRMSAFDQDPGVRPVARQFVAYAAAWEPIPDDQLTRYDEAIPAGTRPPGA